MFALVSSVRLVVDLEVALEVILGHFFPRKRWLPSFLLFQYPFGRGLVTLLVGAISRGVRLVVD